MPKASRWDKFSDTVRVRLESGTPIRVTFSMSSEVLSRIYMGKAGTIFISIRVHAYEASRGCSSIMNYGKG